MTSSGMPVVLVPGLWLHSTSWKDRVELFRESGWEPVANDKVAMPSPGRPLFQAAGANFALYAAAGVDR